MKKITRAQFLSGFGALALGAVASPLVAACGGDDAEEASGGPVSPAKVSDITVKVRVLADHGFYTAHAWVCGWLLCR